MHTAAVAISQINIITLRSYVHVQEHTRCQLAPRPQQVHKKGQPGRAGFLDGMAHTSFDSAASIVAATRLSKLRPAPAQHTSRRRKHNTTDKGLAWLRPCAMTSVNRVLKIDSFTPLFSSPQLPSLSLSTRLCLCPLPVEARKVGETQGYTTNQFRRIFD